MVSELMIKELELSRAFGKTKELKNAFQGEMSFSSQILQATFWIMLEGLRVMILSQRIWSVFPVLIILVLKSIFKGYFDVEESDSWH